jgi:hypothetical protein
MSIEDLENQLGVQSSEKTPEQIRDITAKIPEERASTNLDDAPEPIIKVKDKPAPEMLENPIVKECHQIYKDGRTNDVEWRWQLGEKIDGIYTDTSDKSEGVLKAISFVLDISTSDLSRFRKFYKSFKFEDVKKKIDQGYSWSHFKILNDIKDTLIKDRIINQIDTKGEAPKTNELQDVVNKEKEQQLDRAAASSSEDSKKSSIPSPSRPINSALKVVEKLGDYLGDIYIQIESGIDFASEKQEEKYNESFNDLKVRLGEIIEMSNKIINGKNITDEKPTKKEENGP